MADLLHEHEKTPNAGRSKSDIEIKTAFAPVSFDRLVPSLLEGKGDLIAAMMTITPEREEQVDFVSAKRLSGDEVVVTTRSAEAVESLQDLFDRSVYVLRGSSHLSRLRQISKALVGQDLEPIEIVESDPNLVFEDILELVNAGVVEMTVVDDFKANLWAQVLPDIVVRSELKVNSGGNVGWAVRKSNPELDAHLGKFVETIKKGSVLGNILFKRHYQSTRWIKNPVADEERKKFEQVTSLFKKYADDYGFEHLSAQASTIVESSTICCHEMRAPECSEGKYLAAGLLARVILTVFAVGPVSLEWDYPYYS